ncbi:hypothetical protein MRB53_037935 [Persea americana]|nr:hypothetical protein MRB53_037935 [Persea americana]
MPLILAIKTDAIDAVSFIVSMRFALTATSPQSCPSHLFQKAGFSFSLMLVHQWTCHQRQTCRQFEELDISRQHNGMPEPIFASSTHPRPLLCLLRNSLCSTEQEDDPSSFANGDNRIVIHDHSEPNTLHTRCCTTICSRNHTACLESTIGAKAARASIDDFDYEDENSHGRDRWDPAAQHLPRGNILYNFHQAEAHVHINFRRSDAMIAGSRSASLRFHLDDIYGSAFDA